MPSHNLINSEINYYQHESTFNCVNSKNNLPKIKYGVYIKNIDEYINQ